MKDPDVFMACPVCGEEERCPELRSTDAFLVESTAFLARHAHAEGQLIVRGIPVVRPAAAERAATRLLGDREEK